MIETIIKGGVMMIPLLACSVAAVAVIIDRLKAFTADLGVEIHADGG